MPASLKLNLIASRQWALFQGGLCCCALLTTVMLPIAFWQIIIAVICLFIYSYYLSSAWLDSSVVLLLQKKQILLNDRPVALRTVIVWPWLVVLCYDDLKTDRSSRQLIFTDCCAADEHRQLRAYLRFHHSLKND